METLKCLPLKVQEFARTVPEASLSRETLDGQGKVASAFLVDFGAGEL